MAQFPCQFNYVEDAFHVEKLSITDLTKKVATPFYLYSYSEIKQNYQRLSQALNKVNAQVFYAVKANSNQAILKVLASLGSGADVVSEGELKRALQAGIPANKIVFSGVGKTASEISFALKSGILQFNVESEAELEHISELCVSLKLTAKIAIRINPDIEANTHAKISTGKAENKFGIEHTRTLDIYQYAANLPGIQVQGIDVHIGSQINDLEPFEASFKRISELVCQLRDKGHEIEIIDIGGGLGVSYDAETDEPFDINEYASLVEQHLTSLGCNIIVEPGRSLLASAGALITQVSYIKNTKDKQFLILDAGMNDFARPSLYDAYHQILPVSLNKKENAIYDIVGPVCETGDTFAKSRSIPSVQQGDYLVIKDTGAYGSTMSSNYNTRPFIQEIMVKDSQFSTIRELQTLEELISKDKLPDWL
ncbi:diaminopimelate decarboxylase [Colwellia sp. RSH04]|uniref:diaminopimelate decarboxylase n=1 Tax=Colwellia sp. RSH04 TaxID=2305464 RepID=UPI000E573FD8|nr:diaminopimelate decarboxylase [Colwellia sp. RSH04]RHW76494.1 diaminopimelate decarboxylase [Colwellia sp. RSH04]